MFRVIAVCLLCAAGASVPAEDWIGFRGGQHYGASTATNLPAEWDDNKNIVWKQDLPGLGTSCPVLIGPRVYLTCYSGYGQDAENPGEQSNLVRHVVCLDRSTGSTIWKKDFPAKLPESNYRPGLDSMHGYASSSIASNGKQLFLFFGVSGAYCLDLDGEVLWSKDLGSGKHGWGSAASPVVHGNVAIFNASIESRSLVGLDTQTGDELWRVQDIKDCWSTPTLVNAGGRTEVVLNVPNRLTAYDPATGEEYWHCDGCPDGYLCPSAIAEDGIVYITGARKNTTIAVKAGGTGNVTDTHVLWRKGKGSNVCSLAKAGDYLYFLHDKNGVATCLDAKTGDVKFEKRLRPRPGIIYASLTSADGKLYAASQEGATFVLEATPDGLNQLAVNTFESDQTRTNASISVGSNRLFLRTDKAVYCIGKE